METVFSMANINYIYLPTVDRYENITIVMFNTNWQFIVKTLWKRFMEPFKFSFAL